MRLLGIDLFRIIAAFGVVVIHGLGGIPFDSNASNLKDVFSNFSVPFFLATAFYFAGISLQSNQAGQVERRFLLLKRMQRILIPFICWTIIYLSSRAIKQLIFHDGSFNKLISDPIVLLFGFAGVQLYFLPMLATGTAMAFLMVNQLKIKKPIYWVGLAVMSLVIFNWFNATGNLFSVGSGFALVHLFPNLYALPFFREIFVLIAWVVGCLPYIFISLIIAHGYTACKLEELKLQENQLLRLTVLIAFIGLMSLTIIQLFGGSIPCISILFSYSALILGIGASAFLKQFSFLQKIGKFTFGIYLIHGLFADGLAPLLNKIQPAWVPSELSITSLILFATVIFGLSLLLTFLISRNRIASKLLLGS